MIGKIIDAHIHFDLYHDVEQEFILKSMKQNNIAALITVSNNLASAQRNIASAKKDARIYPAIGFHPEQEVPTENEIDLLIDFIYRHQAEMIAVGEVGLPYYLRKSNSEIPLEPYIELLERFVILAKELDKPIILHAIYDDAPIVCTLLEKHNIKKAHFHWFKGDSKIVERIARNGYKISVTPDVVYKKATQQLIKTFPLQQIMVETDGPWPFSGPYEKQVTQPRMIHDSLQKIAEVKQLDLETIYNVIYQHTVRFYQLPIH